MWYNISQLRVRGLIPRSQKNVTILRRGNSVKWNFSYLGTWSKIKRAFLPVATCNSWEETVNRSWNTERRFNQPLCTCTCVCVCVCVYRADDTTRRGASLHKENFFSYEKTLHFWNEWNFKLLSLSVDRASQSVDKSTLRPVPNNYTGEKSSTGDILETCSKFSTCARRRVATRVPSARPIRLEWSKWKKFLPVAVRQTKNKPSNRKLVRRSLPSSIRLVTIANERIDFRETLNDEFVASRESFTESTNFLHYRAKNGECVACFSSS